MSVAKNQQRRLFRKITIWFAGCAAISIIVFSLPGIAQNSTPNSQVDIMEHLNSVLHWAREWGTADITLSRPGDEVYIDNGRSLAQQVVKLEFQSALAQAALLGDVKTTSNRNGQSSNETQNLMRLQQQIVQRTKDIQQQINVLAAKIPKARAKDRPALQTQQDNLQGQLQLAQALQDNLQKLSSFVMSTETVGGAANDLTKKILALQQNTPGFTSIAQNSKDNKAPAPAPVVHNVQNDGLIGQLGQMFRLVTTTRTLNRLDQEAVQLQATTRQLRAPLLAALRTTLQQGQLQLSGNAPASAESSAVKTADTTENPAQKKKEMADLVEHFKLLSGATLPLSQQLILLEESQANLDQLQASLKHDYISILRSLLLRVGGLLLALGIIWLLAELWRRATFRYVHDARRRRQFLVFRRVVLTFCMFIVILLGFVSDFSSLATYAGLITAGIAVALQAIILSVAAYFFLVGRYGVRVGDRATVYYAGANSVTGDVVDIGLVRFYMMELVGDGVDMQPTGRICAFPNSVLFQTNPLFRQLPGTEYTWREVVLPLQTQSDGNVAEKQLMGIIQKMYSEYQPMLERQHQSIESTLAFYVEVPKPYTRLRFNGSGMEIIVRYPIPLRRAGELDDRVVLEVEQMLRNNPAIQLLAGASPSLRSPVKA